MTAGRVALKKADMAMQSETMADRNATKNMVSNETRSVGNTPPRFVSSAIATLIGRKANRYDTDLPCHEYRERNMAMPAYQDR